MKLILFATPVGAAIALVVVVDAVVCSDSVVPVPTRYSNEMLFANSVFYLEFPTLGPFKNKSVLLLRHMMYQRSDKSKRSDSILWFICQRTSLYITQKFSLAYKSQGHRRGNQVR